MLCNRIYLKFTTAGLHQPGVLWPRSIICLHSQNTTSISSEKSHCIEKHSEWDARSQVFLLPKNNIFCFTINWEVQASTLPSWNLTGMSGFYLDNNILINYTGFSCSCAIPSCPHALPAPFLESKNRLKWTECQLSAPPYKCGKLSHTAVLQRTRMTLEYYLSLCFSRLQQTDPCHLLSEGESSNQNTRIWRPLLSSMLLFPMKTAASN